MLIFICFQKLHISNIEIEILFYKKAFITLKYASGRQRIILK
jgi:hypothetical protein